MTGRVHIFNYFLFSCIAYFALRVSRRKKNTEVILESTESDRPNEFDWKQFLGQFNISDSTMAFHKLEKVGWKAYSVAIEYGNLISRNCEHFLNLFNFPFSKKSLESRNLTQSGYFLLIGHAFFEGRFGHFIISSLEICTHSFDRLFRRLQLLTNDTVVVIPSESHLTLKRRNEIDNDNAVASPRLDAESSGFFQPATKIEPSTPSKCVLPIENSESSGKTAESRPEKEYLAESMPSSNRTIVYENVTGLEKLFVLMLEVFILFPLNAAIALLRFLRAILRDLEDSAHAFQMNVTNGRRVKIASSMNKTILLNRLQKFYSDILKPGYLDDSVMRLEYKSYCLPGSNTEFLDKEMDSVTFYWEENDSDYQPMDASSDTCTGSDSDVDISPEEVNHILLTVEKPQEISLKSDDQLMQSNDKDDCPNKKELVPIKKKRVRKRKRRNRKSKSGMTKTTEAPENLTLPS